MAKVNEKEDCIFMRLKTFPNGRRVGNCTCLTMLYCEKEDRCAFYKSSKEYMMDGRKKECAQ